MYKKHSLILLPTNEKSNIWLRNNKLKYNCSASSKINPQHLYILSDDKIKENDWFINLYSNNIFQNKNGYGVRLSDKYANYALDLETCKKIIATTNTSLKIEFKDGRMNGVQTKRLPQIPFLFVQHYIEQYNLGNVITEVEVEYEIWNVFSGDHNNTPQEISLKLNLNNTINIKPLKDSWTREEVRLLICKYAEENGKGWLYIDNMTTDKWIKENL